MKSAKSLFWSRAAVYGGLWGVVEVTLGGFLHTLRIPLAGIFLAACEAGFLVAVRRITNAEGIALASAFVAACVRCLAPAGALLNPFIGIVMEGLMVELAFLALPGYALPAFVGGGAATLWALVQAILTQIIFFGSATVQVYELVYAAAQKTLGTGLADVALPAPVVFIVLVGGFSGLWGLKLGEVVRKRMKQEVEA